MVSVNVFWQRPQSYYDQDWRGTWALDGGALMNQASHYIDLLDWIVGPVKSVNASLPRLAGILNQKILLQCICVGITELLDCRGDNAYLPKNLEGSITLLGESGTVKIGTAVNQIEHWNFADHHEDDKLVNQASYDTTSVYGFGHPPFYRNMLDTLQFNEVPMCSGHDGLRSLEILVSAYTSAKEDKTIYLSNNN